MFSPPFFFNFGKNCDFFVLFFCGFRGNSSLPFFLPRNASIASARFLSIHPPSCSAPTHIAMRPDHDAQEVVMDFLQASGVTGVPADLCPLPGLSHAGRLNRVLLFASQPQDGIFSLFFI